MAHHSTYKSPEYKANVQKWIDTEMIYSGRAYDHNITMNDNGKPTSPNSVISRYIPQKTQRENNQAYAERLLLLYRNMMFFTGVTSMVGVWAGSEQNTDRVWSNEDKQGFGDENDPDSLAYKLINNADGANTNWSYVINRLAVKLTTKQKVWVYVDGRPKDANGKSVGEASVKIIDPEHVPNYWVNPETGRIEWVIVEEMRDVRASHLEEPKLTKCFTEFSLDGWRRYYIQESDKKEGEGAEVVIGSDTYAYYRTKDKNDKILPIFPAEIPLDVNPGYLWAMNANSVMNFESRLDFAHMTLAFSLLQLVAKDQEQLDMVLKNLLNSNVITQNPESSRDHKFLEQDSSYLQASAERLKEKVKDFHYSMFKAYGDAAREKSATEILIDSQTGLEAWLTLLNSACEEAENGALWRLSQTYFPDKPQLWGDAHVSRKADFSPKDTDEVLDKIQDRYFDGKAIPLLPEQRERLLKMFYGEDGIPIPEDQEEAFKALIDQFVASLSQESNLFSDLGLN